MRRMPFLLPLVAAPPASPWPLRLTPLAATTIMWDATRAI